MTDALVAEAAVMYLDGDSLATVANEFMKRPGFCDRSVHWVTGSRAGVF
jgi:hypothetical protein